MTNRQNKGPEGAVLAEYMECLKGYGIQEQWGPASFRWASYRDRADSDAAPVIERMPDFAALGEIQEYMGGCTRCKLHSGRTNIVFGVGNPNARIVFVGEGPGQDEDIKGEPFVGKAGQLLTDIIEKGMKMKRGDVYIANIVKCRPPGNRNPEPDEIAACEGFLHAQLAVIRPKVICALGKFAAQTLLGTTEPISRLRGNVYEYRGIKLVPTFHPAYLLRNPDDKKLTWAD
ncbi:MAG TPA: uracil-DNA glycosylase, partial [Nitrospirota bacterium]